MPQHIVNIVQLLVAKFRRGVGGSYRFRSLFKRKQKSSKEPKRAKIEARQWTKSRRLWMLGKNGDVLVTSEHRKKEEEYIAA